MGFMKFSRLFLMFVIVLILSLIIVFVVFTSYSFRNRFVIASLHIVSLFSIVNVSTASLQ